MALYTIADLHLSGSVDKPMDKFGSRWTDHTEKIRRRWLSVVGENDTVVVPGDISWGMTLSEAEADLRFIESLPGKKLLGKGNHDFWWTSCAKMKKFMEDIGVTSVDFLHNNAHRADGFLIAGSRGWFIEEKLQNDIFDADYSKLVNREVMRLEASITEAEKLRTSDSEEILVFMHFPPVCGDFICQPIIDVMKKHSVTRCFCGHIHGRYELPPSWVYDDVKVSLISADHLNFCPLMVIPR